MIQPDKRRRVPHVCSDCGCVRRLKPSDAAKTKKCVRCHCREIAPPASRRLPPAKGGLAIRAAARKRKQRPSSPEQRVEAALREIPARLGT